MMEFCKHNLLKNECSFCLIEKEGINVIKDENMRLFIKSYYNSQYGNFVNKKSRIPKDNQFIREINLSRKKSKLVFDYLEREKNHIVYFDTSGCIMCINSNQVLYETSINTVYDMIKEIKYTKQELEYSNRIKLFLSLDYIDDINPILRKIKCIFHRILKLKLRKKNFRISKKKEKLFEMLYQLKIWS